MMGTRILTAWLGLPAAVLLVAGPVSAIELRRNVIAGGGGTVDGDAYTSFVTVGEPAVGRMSSASYVTDTGFWVPLGHPLDAVEPGAAIPLVFALSAAHPNPVGNRSVIEYSVPRSVELSIKLHDVQGRVIRTLIAGTQGPGHHRVELRAEDLPGGVYFYRMAAPGFVQTRKVLLLR